MDYPLNPATLAIYVGCAQQVYRPVFVGLDMGRGPDMTATFTPCQGAENKVVSPEEGSVGGRPFQPLHIRGCL